jgi:PqqD family protein of HPr-rel-A system
MTRWSVPRWRDFLWERWETGYSLYDCGTGETHLLNELPAEILRLLFAEPRSEEAVAAVLAEACEVVDDDQWRERIGAVIGNLAALDLVSRFDT